MANRRDFIAAAGGAGLASMGGLGTAGSETEDTSNGRRDLYELCRYVIDHEPQRQAFDAFQRDAAIPALNRLGITPVGVFYPENELSPIYVLLRHRSAESLLTDAEAARRCRVLRKGADFLNAPADKPAFQRMESSLLLAFRACRHWRRPDRPRARLPAADLREPQREDGPEEDRDVQHPARSPSSAASGCNPVFFGETLSARRCPT